MEIACKWQGEFFCECFFEFMQILFGFNFFRGGLFYEKLFYIFLRENFHGVIMLYKDIKKKVKDDYNAIAEEFSSTRSFPWSEFEDFLPYYKTKSDVLDLGCGNGRLFKFLEGKGVGDYVGVDNSEELISIAKAKNPRGEFLVADISSLKGMRSVLKSGKKFDAIFAIASFHHLPASGQIKSLKLWKSLLEPGGYLFMTNWNLFQVRFWKEWLSAIFHPKYGFFGLQIPWKMKGGKIVKRFYFAFTKRRLESLFLQAGLKIVLFKNGRNFVTIARA
jgi:tRNA (uracil-5-)-methyltransferase TRM9